MSNEERISSTLFFIFNEQNYQGSYHIIPITYFYFLKFTFFLNLYILTNLKSLILEILYYLKPMGLGLFIFSNTCTNSFFSNQIEMISILMTFDCRPKFNSSCTHC